jgi:hypothetical protein
MNTRIRAAIVTAAAFGFLSASVPVRAETTEPDAAPVVASSAHCAPADEDFGKLRLSILGVRNNISDTATRLDRGAVDVQSTLEHLALVEDSLRDLEAKYPQDGWLPRMVLDLHRVYRRIGTEEAVLRSVDVASWLLRAYPGSREAQALRGDLARALQDPAAPAAGTAVREGTVADKP